VIGATQTIDGTANRADDARREAHQNSVAHLGFATCVAVDGGTRTVNSRGQGGVDFESIQPVAHNEVGGSGVNAVRGHRAAVMNMYGSSTTPGVPDRRRATQFRPLRLR
jgi:hypothetical protein